MLWVRSRVGPDRWTWPVDGLADRREILNAAGARMQKAAMSFNGQCSSWLWPKVPHGLRSPGYGGSLASSSRE